MKVEIRNDGATIEGYVNVVERLSRPIYDASGSFFEKVMPGVFQKAIANKKDIELRFDHARKLGSVEDGALSLKEDNIGLYAVAKTTDPEVIEKAKKGELRGWSFGFVKVKDNWPEGEKRIRELEEIELREVSILDMTPAYIATSIEMREKNELLLEFRADAAESVIVANMATVDLSAEEQRLEILKNKKFN